jgi:UDP-N-acetyl-2-amino-2-deoxyglucuronate dehydrogenase
MNFALIGASGYIAPRHMMAIRETGNQLIAALDPYDGVGIMDSYFPDCDFFTEPERFDRHLDKLRRLAQGRRAKPDIKVDYVSICSPNYMHDSHIRLALRNEAHAICEKPLVLNPWNIELLQQLEKESGKKIFTILQLRLHPAILELKRKIEQGPKDKVYSIDLTYITSRGQWYHRSWKGNQEKSGGIATNIGVHFFDMLTWIFGKVKVNQVHLLQADKASGYLELEKARVRWFLGIDYHDIPEAAKKAGKRTFRSLLMDDHEIEFSDGFTGLHTDTYRAILRGKGFGIADARQSIHLVHQIRTASITPALGDFHPLLLTVNK